MKRVSRNTEDSKKTTAKFKNKIKEELNIDLFVPEKKMKLTEDNYKWTSSTSHKQSPSQALASNEVNTFGNASEEIENTIEEYKDGNAALIKDGVCNLESSVSNKVITPGRKSRLINHKCKMIRKKKVTRKLRLANFRATLMAEKYKRKNAQLKTKFLATCRKKQSHREIKNKSQKKCPSSAKKHKISLKRLTAVARTCENSGKCREDRSEILKDLPESSDIKFDNSNPEKTCGQEQIRCMCGVKEEEGLMIQCDNCHYWQHASCNEIENEDDVPQQFSCYFCQYIPNEHHHHHKNESDDMKWYYDGHLPRFSFLNEDEDRMAKEEALLAKTHQFLAELEYLKEIQYSLQVKMVVAKTPNHPKLINWSSQVMDKENHKKSMDTVVNNGNSDYPQPEKAIDFNECTKNLLKHIEETHRRVEIRINNIGKEFEALEESFTSSENNVSDTDIKHSLKEVMGSIDKILHCVNKNE